MGKPVFLLGAGASIDAGLFDTNRLTREIYKILGTGYDKTPLKIFGYIIAKILSRKVRQGGSPFDDVNVEEAYDGVERLVFRDKDIVSEFVSSWDPFLDSLRPNFNKETFIRNLQACVRIDYSRSLTRQPSLRFDHTKLRDVADEIEKSGSSFHLTGDETILSQLVSALIKCLKHDSARIEYMTKLVKFIHENGGVIASLNYDLVAESALANAGLSYDYGLSSWNSKKLVGFPGGRGTVRLMKLHGSMNWFTGGDDIIISTDPGQRVPLMVFGGAAGKLRPDGPFLQLRHEFERQLLATNIFVVVGYSFGDGHLNAIVRSWVSTRRKAKLIIVNPGAIPMGPDVLGTPYRISKESKLESKTVDIIHIKKKTAVAVQNIISSALNPPDLTIPKRDGFLPQMLIQTITD